jgi:hypothetical protein
MMSEAGVPERPKGPVCKTGGESLRGFESRPLLWLYDAEVNRNCSGPGGRPGAIRLWGFESLPPYWAMEAIRLDEEPVPKTGIAPPSALRVRVSPLPLESA